MPDVVVSAPPFIPTAPVIKIGTTGTSVEIHCAAESVEVTPEQEENTVETFCGTYTTYKAEEWTITASVFLSYGTTPPGLWNSLRPLCGTVQPFEFSPDDGAVGPGNPKMTGTCIVRGFPFFSGGPGAPTAVEVVLAVQGAPDWTEVASLGAEGGTESSEGTEPAPELQPA